MKRSAASATMPKRDERSMPKRDERSARLVTSFISPILELSRRRRSPDGCGALRARAKRDDGCYRRPAVFLTGNNRRYSSCGAGQSRSLAAPGSTALLILKGLDQWRGGRERVQGQTWERRNRGAGFGRTSWQARHLRSLRRWRRRTKLGRASGPPDR